MYINKVRGNPSTRNKETIKQNQNKDMNFCGERFKPNLCRVQKKTNFSKKGCEIWVCQLKFFARKNSEFRPNECKCKIYIQEFCGKNLFARCKKWVRHQKFLRGKKKRIFCVEVKANLSKTNECEGFLHSYLFNVFS